jgi:hypothetical protein
LLTISSWTSSLLHYHICCLTRCASPQRGKRTLSCAVIFIIARAERSCPCKLPHTIAAARRCTALPQEHRAFRSDSVTVTCCRWQRPGPHSTAPNRLQFLAIPAQRPLMAASDGNGNRSGPPTGQALTTITTLSPFVKSAAGAWDACVHVHALQLSLMPE